MGRIIGRTYPVKEEEKDKPSGTGGGKHAAGKAEKTT